MVRRKNQNGRRRIRYAVVGLGYISQIAVLPAFEHAHENSELTALVSGDAETLKKPGRKYSIENAYTYEQYGDCLKGGEIDAVAMMKFPENRIATFTSSFGATDRSEFEIVGTKGALKMDPAYEMAEDLKLELNVGGKTAKQVFKKRDQFAPELIYFSNCILLNKEPEPSAEEGLADVRVIQALLQSAETNRPIEMTKAKIERRPQAEQEISKETIQKPPKLVKAAAPGRH